MVETQPKINRLFKLRDVWGKLPGGSRNDAEAELLRQERAAAEAPEQAASGSEIQDPGESPVM